MASKRRQRKRTPSRRAATRQPRRRLLVVCEGEKTEPDYILGFERWVRNASVEIVIPPERGDPKVIVEIAKERSGRAAAEAKKQGDSFLDYDEVWCVFDRDDHERFHDARTMARDNGFQLALSNPCFELWLLLHFRDSPGPQHRDHLTRMLRGFLPSYSKRVDFDDFEHGRLDATGRARRLDAQAEVMGEPGRNPTTGVYRLTESIARDDS